MKQHTKIYIEYFNFQAGDFIPCEVCEARAVDIHHIVARGMGGGRGKNEILNLMALCRPCHFLYGDKKQYKEFLKEIHESHMNKRAQLN